MSERFLVDEYDLGEVERALRSLTLTEKTAALLVAHATAPNRAMSRLELARAIGSNSVNACNTVYGGFAKKLATALDPTLIERWKPAHGRKGDFVMFLHFGPERWTRASPGEVDTWVFVMRESLAQALARTGIATYTPLETKRFAALYGRLPHGASRDAFSDVDDADASLNALSDTEYEAIVSARIGQGKFRESLMSYWHGRCAATGVDVPEALVASHIKPWRDANNMERLDVFNGLLLTGTLDRLFDAALVSFDDNGEILISPSLTETQRRQLGIRSSLRLAKLDDAHRQYLRGHRERFGA